MITMTETAAQKIKEDIQSRSLPENTVLRVDVEQAAGEDKLQLALRLDPREPQVDDEVQDVGGTRLAVRKELAQAVGDARLDFRDDAGFVLERTTPTQ